MKRFLFYFLAFILLVSTNFAFAQNQVQSVDEIPQTLTLINQHKYDEALRLIYSLNVPSNKEEKALYYLAKIKALRKTPYRANNLIESETDPTKFTNTQKQDAIKAAYKELWALRTTLINMPYAENKKYIDIYYGNNYDSLYDALVNAFIGAKIESDIAIYKESYKLQGAERDAARETWHMQYILAEIAKQNNTTIYNFDKERVLELAQLFAAISGLDKNYKGQFKKYFFEAKTQRGKIEAALKSINYYQQAEQFDQAHAAAEYCEMLDDKNRDCASIKQNLERPSVYINGAVPQNYKPNTVLPLKFVANNLEQVNFKLYKISLEEMQNKTNNFKALSPYKTYPQNLTYDKPYTPKEFDFNLPALPHGFYALTLDYDNKNPSVFYLNITDLALIATDYFTADNLQNMKYKDTNVHFYTLSAKSGAPLAASIKLETLAPVKADISYNMPDEVVKKNLPTAQDGQTNIKSAKTLRKIVAKYKNSYALIDSIYPQTYSKHYPTRVYINTDRSIYKPGEEVQMVFNVAEEKNNKYFVYQGKEKLNVRVFNASRKEVAQISLPLDDFGQAKYTFKIPADTMLGTFQINANFEGQSGTIQNFQVDEFKQPEFSVVLNTPDNTYAYNSKVSIDGKAAYYSGEPLAGVHVVLSIIKQAFYPCCYRWNNFDFEQEPPLYIETLTDKNGNFKFSFTPKSKKADKVLPSRYLIKADVTGTNGHTISAETNLYVANQKYFFSIEKTKNFFLTDTENILTLKLQNAAAKAQKGKAILEVYEAALKDSKNLTKYPSQDNFELAKEAVFKTDINFEGEDVRQKLPLLKEGFYGAKLKAGKEESEAFIFPIFDAQEPSLQMDDIVTYAENDKYIVGENARILLGANNAKGIKFAEIYKNGFLIKRLKLSNKPLQILTLPVLPDYQGGISLRWFGVYDYHIYNGKVDIEIPYLQKDVKVELKASNNLEPGQEAKINLTANINGNTLPNARAILTVYDKALDYYKKHNFGISSPYLQQYSYNNIFSSLQEENTFYYAPALSFGMARGGTINLRAAKSMAVAEESAAMDSNNNIKAKNVSAQIVEDNDFALRSDFAPTAYFNPGLNLTNSKAEFNFKMPDSLTAWTAAAIVFSKTMQTGNAEINFTTSKDLTLRLETPKFIRQNDEIIFVTLVKNNTKKPLLGEVSLTLKLNEETVKNYEIKQISLKAGEEKPLTWSYKAPKELGSISLTAAVRSGDFIDGETRTLPLLTSLQYLPNSKTITLKEGANTFELSPLKEGEILDSVHLTLDTSLLAPIISTIPMLVEKSCTTAICFADGYLPLSIINQLYNTNANFRSAAKQISRKTETEKWNKQTEEILLQDTEMTPWYNISKGGQNKNFINIFDKNTVVQKQKNYLDNLKKFQNKDGGFSWLKGGKSNLFITLQVVDKLAQASYFGVNPPMELTQNALKYLHNEYKKFDLKSGLFPFNIVYYAYVISAFDKTLLVQSTRQEVQTLANYIDKNIENLPPLGKVYMATVYHRLGNTQKAKKYINLLFETARENEVTGLTFAMEGRSWQWFEDGLILHAEALKMLLEVQPNSPKIEGLIKWLIFNKKATMWGSTANAAKAVYALLEAVKDYGITAQNKNYKISWNGQNYNINFGAFDKENKTVFNAYAPLSNDALKAEITQSTTVAQNKKAAKTLPDFATLSDLIISDLPQKASPEGILNISKNYYLIEGNTVRPLKENEKVKVGAKIQVRLTIKAEHNFDFVMIQDKKPAAFDTENLLSGWVWDGLARYEDLQLSQTNFFMDSVPVGTYELKYVLRPTAEGVFNVGPSIIQSMFAPEVSAHSGSFFITVEK